MNKYFLSRNDIFRLVLVVALLPLVMAAEGGCNGGGSGEIGGNSGGYDRVDEGRTDYDGNYHTETTKVPK